MPLIRTATRQDLRAIATLEENWEREGSIIGFEAGGIANFASYVDSLDKSIWVAESSNEIVGYASATVHESSKLAVVPHEEPYGGD